MKRVIIVQARMGSTRLPGKVLEHVEGVPMLALQIERLRRCRSADEIVIATTAAERDEPVVALAEELAVRWYRGSESDVLARYVGAARDAGADVIVRVTADCPLIDPAVTDRVIEALLGSGADYASNTQVRTYPRGLDTEVFHQDVLRRIDRMADSRPAREHVTYFINYDRPDLFVRESVEDSEDNSDLRWTVDEQADLDLVREIYARFEARDPGMECHALVRAIRAAGLAERNAHVEQNTH